MNSILLLTPQLPYPPEQGTSLRNYNILLGLLRRYRVTLMSFVDAPPSAEAVERLSGCERLIAVPAPERNMATRLGRMVSDGRPDMAHRLQSPQFEMTLTRLLLQGGGAPEKAVEPFDVVQVEGIELSFAIDIVRRHEPAPKIIFDDHNAEYELQRRAYLADRFTPSRLPATLYSMVQARRLRAYERRICNSADHVVAVSENDGRLLSELGIETPVSIIPNSIDVRDYAPDGTLPLRYDLVFVGKMDYRPNVDAVLWFWSEVWPALKRQRPAITWAIVGKNPHTRLDALSTDTSITITGRVDRVQPYLHSSKICIMPFRVGGGTRLKLIEAMASDLAIASTTVGAEGFELQSGKQLLLADTPSDFGDAILTLLDDREYRQELSREARKFADQYDWRQVSPRFYKIIDKLLETN